MLPSTERLGRELVRACVCERERACDGREMRSYETGWHVSKMRDEAVHAVMKKWGRACGQRRVVWWWRRTRRE